jgi:hypothetical protein
MAIIKLHTPIHTLDYNTTTDYEANDIIHVESAGGEDDGVGTNFYIKGVDEIQFCLETANKLKQLINDNKTEEKQFSVFQSGSGNAMAIGNGNESSVGGKEGGWTISGWWIGLIGTVAGLIALALGK